MLNMALQSLDYKGFSRSNPTSNIHIVTVCKCWNLNEAMYSEFKAMSTTYLGTECYMPDSKDSIVTIV